MKTRSYRFLFLLVCIVAICLGAIPLFKQSTVRITLLKANDRVGIGEILSREQAQQLEQSLLSKPHNIVKRGELIRYYWQTREKQFRLKHVLWLIHNHPEAQVLQTMEGTVFGRAGSDKAVLQAWDEKFRSSPKSRDCGRFSVSSL